MITVGDLNVYDVKECAEILKVNPQTVRRYMRQGKLKNQTVGGKKYATEETLQEFLKGGSNKQ